MMSQTYIRVWTERRLPYIPLNMINEITEEGQTVSLHAPPEYNTFNNLDKDGSWQVSP